MKRRFYARIVKNFHTMKCMKIPPVEAEMFDAIRQTDRQTRRSLVTFRNFENGLNISLTKRM